MIGLLLLVVAKLAYPPAPTDHHLQHEETIAPPDGEENVLPGNDCNAQ